MANLSFPATKMWRYIVLFACLFVPAFASADDTEKKLIVCSTTQVADLTRQIVGDRCDVRCVLAAGQDPHKYTPGNDDLLLIGKSDLCIRNGWNLEGSEWMKALADNSGKTLVTCVTGVQPRQMEEHGKTIKDPHAWLIPKNGLKYAENIRDAVTKLEPKYADEFQMRFDFLRMQLLALDRWIRQEIGKVPGNRRVLITHHDAFGYFCDSYGFSTFSPVGWSTGELSEVSNSQRQEIVKQIREQGVPTVFVETSTNPELLGGIARDAGVVVGDTLYSDAMGPRGSAGESYVGMMRENVVRIVRGLAPSKK